MKEPLRLLLLVWLTYIRLVSSVTLSDYCSVNVMNTPCVTKCERAPRCGRTPGDIHMSLSQEEQVLAVKIHNEFRQQVASGNETALPASDGGIYVLSYDKEAEFVAGCHAKQCKFDSDAIRLTSTGEKLGQNIYTYSLRLNRKDFIRKGISTWYGEVSELDGRGKSLVEEYSKFPAVGHLTQLIWGQSMYVGCALMHYKETTSDKYQLVCNYKPSGNRLSEKVYETKGYCNRNSKYPALCGVIRTLGEDTYHPPVDLSKASIIYHFFASKLLFAYFIRSIVDYAL